jgi:hypothetical protein
VATGDGGDLLQALTAQDAAMAAADRIVAKGIDNGPLCSPGIRPAAADILTNVIHKYFIEGIQPRAAALNRRLHQLLPPIRELEQILGAALPPSYQRWSEQRDSELLKLSQAPRRHVQLLQDIQRPCGTNPGQGRKSGAGDESPIE